MEDALSFPLFGDQSLNTYPFLAEFYRNGNPSVLAKTFLEQAGQALREEVDKLTKTERSKIPVFRTLQQLNERYNAHATRHPGLDSALLSITLIAHYIE